MSLCIGDKNIVIIFLYSLTVISAYHVDVVHNGPIVKGATITFHATLYDEYNNLASGDFRYDWEDVAVPVHSAEHKISSPKDTWSVTYNASIYPAGRYVAQVTVSKYFILLWAEVASSRVEFHINGFNICSV